MVPAMGDPDLAVAGPVADETAEPAVEISVVIVSWNAGQDLLSCLGSLAEHAPSVPWEAVVVDNASTDGSIDRVRHELPWVRLIENHENRGLPAANNQGIAGSRGRFVLISNPDVIFHPGAIDALLGLLRRRERAGFAAANLRYPDGGLQVSVGALPTLRQAFVGRRLAGLTVRGRDARMWWYGWAHDEERLVGHGAEACYLVRREAIGDIGVQDERFVLDWEGLEWSRRAADVGWEVWFSPEATVTHLEAVSRGQVRTRSIVSSHLGMYLYFRSSYPLGLRPLLAAAVGARALLLLARGAATGAYGSNP